MNSVWLSFAIAASPLSLGHVLVSPELYTSITQHRAFRESSYALVSMSHDA